MTAVSDAEKVRAAADYIERVGLYKGNLFDHAALKGVLGEAYYATNTDEALANGEIVQHGIPCCTYGALLAFGAAGGEDDLLSEFLAHAGVRGAVGPWNDDEERTAEEVVTALRAFADSLDADTE